MVKAVISGDCGRTDHVVATVEGDCRYDDPSVPWSVIPVDGDPVPDPTGTQPLLDVWSRFRTGYDDDGTPTFEWGLLVRGWAVSYTTREEFDSRAGFTMVQAQAMILLDKVPSPQPQGALGVAIDVDGAPYVYVENGGPLGQADDGTPILVEPGTRVAHETMVVQDVRTREWYKVTAVGVIGKRLEMKMARVDSEVMV